MKKQNNIETNKTQQTITTKNVIIHLIELIIYHKKQTKTSKQKQKKKGKKKYTHTCRHTRTHTIAFNFLYPPANYSPHSPHLHLPQQSCLCVLES